VTRGKELRSRKELKQRVSEQDDDEEVDYRRNSEGEREPSDIADREDEQHHGGEQVDSIRYHDCPHSTNPTGFYGGCQCSALSKFITDSFEVHDERIGGDSNRDN
jgi:hypothetical protein